MSEPVEPISEDDLDKFRQSVAALGDDGRLQWTNRTAMRLLATIDAAQAAQPLAPSVEPTCICFLGPTVAQACPIHHPEYYEAAQPLTPSDTERFETETAQLRAGIRKRGEESDDLPIVEQALDTERLAPSERSHTMRPLGPGMSYDWDNATVKVTVPVHHTATVEMTEVSLPLETFARLILTSVPEEWFVVPPTSSDLPLFVEYPPIDDVEAGVRRG